MYTELFTSTKWLVVLRIVAPAWALWASVLASVELARASRNLSPCTLAFWTIRNVVFALEALSSLLIGLALALGNFGPTVMPIGIHSIFQTLLAGTSVMTTALVALFLREEAHHGRNLIPRRSIWREHRLKLVFLAAVTVFYEITHVGWILVLSVAGTYHGKEAVLWEGWLSFMFVVSIALQLVIAAYFMKQAYDFRFLVRIYLWPLEADVFNHGKMRGTLRVVGRLSMWLALSAAFMIITAIAGTLLTLSYLTEAMAQHGKPRDISADFLMVSFWVYSRIGLIYSHVSTELCGLLICCAKHACLLLLPPMTSLFLRVDRGDAPNDQLA